MPWYKAGTVSCTQNSNAVIGAGTAFIANARVGDAFRGPDGGWYEVTNIASDTAMSISPLYQGVTNPTGTYALAPMQGYVKDSADALRALVNQFGGVLAVLGNTPTQIGVRAALNLSDTDGLLEGATNVYFSADRALTTVLTGLVTTTNAPVVATDSIVIAAGKLQAQIAATALSAILKAGGTLSGPLNEAPPQTISSAATVDIGATTSNVIAVSGTTTITALGTIAAGARRTVRFLGSLLLTHNAASLILPGNASITTAANDTAEFLSLGGGNWICLDYTYRLSGKPFDASLADFAIIYPNGGTQASPASVTANSRYVMANPFPGYRAFCKAEIFVSGAWFDPGWWSSADSVNVAYGVTASHIETPDRIIVQTGLNAVAARGSLSGGAGGEISSTLTAPCRVQVWKLKGAI